jgi:bifunctional non-homologous end joining protein LigD
MPQKRQKKVYIDYLQNNYGATVAAPFSARPMETPNVSMPIAWDELTTDLSPGNFTIFNFHERAQKSFELFKPVLAEKTNINNIINKF